jgi:hypothetical protein
VAREGEITHKFTIRDLNFVLKGLNTEEAFLADSMVDTALLKEKYGATNLITLNDTIQKYRTIAMVVLATKTINGQSPIDYSLPLEQQFKQRMELRDELMALDSAMIDQIIREYNQLNLKQVKFYEKIDENLD